MKFNKRYEVPDGLVYVTINESAGMATVKIDAEEEAIELFSAADLRFFAKKLKQAANLLECAG